MTGGETMAGAARRGPETPAGHRPARMIAAALPAWSAVATLAGRALRDMPGAGRGRRVGA